MTTMDFSFAIDVARARVYINAVHATISTSGIATNISSISFAKGAGQIIYNDRPPIPESFTDPSPYQTYVNAWMTAQAPLTLAEAKAIKSALVQAIGNMKAQAPVAVTVSAGSYSWSATGNAALLGGLAWIAPLDTVINGVNSVISAINALISTLNSNATTNKNSINSAFSALASSLNTQFTGQSIAVTAPTEIVSLGSVSSSGLTSLSTLTAPSLSAIPSGSSTPVTLTQADVQAVISAISSQSSSVQGTIASKQAAVNALSTVASVISYDATSGW